MFRRGKTGETDIKKAIQKVQDNRKDNITRLKNLKIVLENSDPREAKTLFEDNSSLVFYIFYDVFINVESDLKQRVNRAHKEELDTVLFVFEKVFLLLPDLIHRRWQFHCIGRLIRKLLHPSNSLKIRREGVRLFLIWYQILQDNAGEECHQLFSSLVPRLSPLPAGGTSGSTSVSGGSAGTGSRASTAPASRQSHSRQGSGTLAAVAGHEGVVTAVDISPILPSQGQGEEACEDITFEFLHTLLQRLVSEVVKVEWSEAEKAARRKEALHFLLEQFKRYYLPVLFPVSAQNQPNLEDCSLYPGPNVSILTRLASERVFVSDIPARKLNTYQEEVIRWLTKFVYVGVKTAVGTGAGNASGHLSEQEGDASASVIDVSGVSSGAAASEAGGGGGSGTISATGGGGGGGADTGPMADASGASSGSQAPIMRDPEFPLGASFSAEEIELMRAVLYSQRENVLLVHEMFARTLSCQSALSQHRAVSCVVTVYREWIRQAVKGHRPVFMLEPAGADEELLKGESGGESGSAEGALSGDTEEDRTVHEEDTDGSSMHTPSENSPAHRPDLTQERSEPKTGSPGLVGSPTADSTALSAWLSSPSVAAGLQRCLQVIFTSSANVFILRGASIRPEELSADMLKSHETICKMVLWFYRHATINATINLTLSADTWGKLLMVLLRIVWEVMSSTSPDDTNSLGSLLAGPLFQTLIVTFVKANLHIRVSRELWDKFMSVLSSLTHWHQLIAEWSKTMSTLTRLLSQHVYGLDLKDLPLDRPSKVRSRRMHIMTRGQHQASGSPGGLSAVQLGKSRSHERSAAARSARGLKGAQIYEQPNLALADSFSCVKLEDVTAHQQATLPSLGPVLSSPQPRPASYAGGGISVSPSSSASARASSRSSADPCGGGGIGEEMQPLIHSSSSSIVGVSGTNVSVPPPGPADHDGLSQASSTASDRAPALYGGGGGPGGDDTSSYASAPEDATSLGAGSASGVPVPSLTSHGPGERGSGGQFEYQQLSTSTTTHGDSSSGCNVSLGFSDTELLSSSLVPAVRPDASELSESDGNSSVDSNITSDDDVDNAAAARPDLSVVLGGGARPWRLPNLKQQRRRRRTATKGKGGTLTREDVTSKALCEEEEMLTATDAQDVEEEVGDDGVDEEEEENSSTPNAPQQMSRQQMVASAERLNAEDPELLSVMAGGRTVGWTAENCVVLWRRILSSLGDINAIQDPTILFTVYGHLSEIMGSLFDIRKNLGVSLDNVTTPAPPALIPPLSFMVSWLFQTLRLPAAFKRAKLIAMSLLCRVTVFRHEMQLPLEHMAQFLRELHITLAAADPDQDLINEVLFNCGPNFFSLPIPGSSLLLFDFIEAAGELANIADPDAPRREAVSILGSLLVLPTHYQLQGQESVTVLRSAADKGHSQGIQVTSVPWAEVKDALLERLLRWTAREPLGISKEVTICSLGIFMYEELANYGGRKLHPRMKEAMLAIYQALRLSERQIACDMLVLLVDHVELLLHEMPDLPLKVVEQCVQVLQSLMTDRRDTSKSEKRLIVSLLFCLVEWCMHLPLSLLLDSTDTHTKGLIYPVFRVLHCVARGGHNATPWAPPPQHPHGPLSGSSGAESMWEVHEGLHLAHLDPLQLNLAPADPGGVSPSADSQDGGEERSRRSGGTSKPLMRSPKLSSKDGLEMVRLAARTALAHLLNHLAQFPVTSAARLDSVVQEWQEVDLLGLEAPLSDLTPGLFEAPNLQFFIVNDCALMSLLTLPAAANGNEDGLVEGHALVRAILRDVSGKHCWDARILYGSHGEMRPGPGSEEKADRAPEASESEREGPEGAAEEKEDQLRELLASLEKSSPELSLQPPSHPAPSLDEASAALEDVATQQLHAQEVWEEHTLMRIDGDGCGAVASSFDEGNGPSALSPFYLCRHLLSQLGFFAWERRPHVDLLKKKDNLLLELKHLDMRSCRETNKIAVLYVAPGQEDKHSILSNASGSRAFEDFVAGLGWEVMLDRHAGFRGGFESSGRTGVSAPYFATSTFEIMFHVATRMPSETDEDRHRKLKHIGNDEVWLVWSEHCRDFRRDLIPTEFGDIMIIVYPIPERAGLLRISIDRKSEVPFFGPLFDGAVVSDRALPGLVRATALNASRVNRSLKRGYLSFYEERARCLDDIIHRYKKSTTFESFARHSFAPILPDDGAVPNLVDQPDGLRDGAALRRHADGAASGPMTADKKEERKSKVHFNRSQYFFGEANASNLPVSETPGVQLRSHSPLAQLSDAESKSPSSSLYRRLSMKTKRSSFKRQSEQPLLSPTRTPAGQHPHHRFSTAFPRPKPNSPSARE